MNKKILNKEYITLAVETVQESVKQLETIKEQFELRSKKFLNVFGVTFPFTLKNPQLEEFYDKKDIGIKNIIESWAWRSIIDKTKITDLMATAQLMELEKEIYNCKMPEFTTENILETLNSLYKKEDEFLNEKIQEAFYKLRPHSENPERDSKYDVPSGLHIKYSYEIDSYSRFTHRIERFWSEWLIAIDDIFHQLDGKRISKYPDDFVTLIEDTINEKKDYLETEYFRCDILEGLIFFKVKRLDLLNKLNKIGRD